MATKKVTPAQIKLAKTLRAKGQNYAEIATSTGLSTGTISSILKGKKVAPEHVAEVPAAKEGGPLTPPTRSELAAHLADQIRQLRADLEKTADLSARASLNRQLVGAQTLLNRVLPDDKPETPEGYYVTSEDMIAAAASARQKLHERLTAITREHGAGK